MGLIDWLWNKTVEPEAQEYFMIEAYNIEAGAQSSYAEAYDSDDDDLDRDRLLGYMLDNMRNRGRLRGELERRGYSYDGYGSDEERHVFSREVEDEEDDEENEEDEEPQRGFFSRLLFG